MTKKKEARRKQNAARMLLEESKRHLETALLMPEGPERTAILQKTKELAEEATKTSNQAVENIR